MRYAMAIDTKKCVGCGDCVVACQTENNVPHGYCRDWIVERVDGTYPSLSLEFRSERCNHCDNSPCVRCCPTGASHIEEGGIVSVTPHKCIGCGACIQSCPYDARYSHPDGYVDKCTFCLHRVQKGQKTACVDVCPTKCLHFGDLDDPNSDVSLAIKDRSWKVLAPEAGTKPQLYFLT
ncbi:MULTISPECIES: 4Fe-4S dicluster domain-containing protein [Draconibacterium]|uniref:Tetrathionate reductase n=1 Tax=Draconibacterium sediminis TaxID=1544798 RepID=A0A0D8JCV3_9BACT|nr:4Fe-4S dicluster domain-containing protein [Draconibacterium sediminis]KJF44544.1 tetrathionate reductase [Draconibacterium sediminis]